MEKRQYEFEMSLDDPSLDEDQNQADGQQKNLTMKDQEQMMQELKKENFDLKLRLYMTQKNGESAEGKASEYEQQLGALLEKLEEQQRLSDLQARELQEMRTREKTLVVTNKRLEKINKEQDEEIHNLSVSLSNINGSFLAGSPQQQSTYITTDYESADDDYGIRPLGPNQPNISAVPPMRRQVSGRNENSGLLKHDHGVHSSVSDDRAYSVHPVTKNYYNTSTPERHSDNVGVVRPNNSRTVVDVELPDSPNQDKEETKKKKGGIGKIFKLCTGKSGQKPARADSMYQKREPARITVTQVNN